MRFNCKIYHSIGENTSMTLHNQDYDSLKEMATDLGLTYNQVADLSCNKEKKDYQKFKFYPKIEITKLKKSNNKLDE
jgi:hypothetical protein